MKKLISLPNGAFVDGTRVIEISNVYRYGEDFIVRVVLEGGTIHILEHSVEWKADQSRIRIGREVNSAKRFAVSKSARPLLRKLERSRNLDRVCFR